MTIDKEAIFKQLSYLAQERDRTDVLLRLVIKQADQMGITIDEMSVNTTLSWRDIQEMMSYE